MVAAMTKLVAPTGPLVLTLAAAGCARATEAGPPVTSPRSTAPAPTSTSAARATPSTVAAPAGANWPAFTSVQGGYRLRHPPGWRVKESAGTGGPVLPLLPPRGTGITVLATWPPPPEAGTAGLPNTRCQPVRVGELEGTRCLETLSMVVSTTLSRNSRSSDVPIPGRRPSRCLPRGKAPKGFRRSG
jgi:hypothetical protein